MYAPIVVWQKKWANKSEEDKGQRQGSRDLKETPAEPLHTQHVSRSTIHWLIGVNKKPLIGGTNRCHRDSSSPSVGFALLDPGYANLPTGQWGIEVGGCRADLDVCRGWLHRNGRNWQNRKREKKVFKITQYLMFQENECEIRTWSVCLYFSSVWIWVNMDGGWHIIIFLGLRVCKLRKSPLKNHYKWVKLKPTVWIIAAVSNPGSVIYKDCEFETIS